jgi:DNA helicase HerA-like ATPase
MAYDIIIGRDKSDKERFGSRGLVYIGKGYVKMGNYTSLSNKIWLDVARSHVIMIAGKRGSGKSYTLGAIAEELAGLPAEDSKNIAPIIFDTMGIFWTMKYKNEKEKGLLDSWELKTKELPIKIFVPFGKVEDYQRKSIPYDKPFALQVSQLQAEDWITLFNLNLTSLPGVLIERVITDLLEESERFTLKEILQQVESDKESSKETKEIVSSLFYAADSWGIFSKVAEGTSLSDIINPGVTTVIDTSSYSSIGAFNIRAMVISLLCRTIFKSRMDARKQEEISSIVQGENYLSYSKTRDQPLVWIFIDEAHEFLPKEGKTPATDALMQILREGRQPGISLVIATQQPGQIHRDAMTQSDIVIAHRVTAKPDIDALNEIMQTYLLENIRKQMDDLPSLKGSALVLDDNSERIYPVRIRPRFTWHGGESPAAIKSEIKID